MTIDEQIQELNNTVKCTLAPSEIHGIGVFALRDIREGEKLYTAPTEYKMYEMPYKKLKKLRPEIKKLVLERWPMAFNDVPFESPNNVGLMSFMNHSEDPNSLQDIASKDIEKGEEVTEDYRIIENYKKIFDFL